MLVSVVGSIAAIETIASGRGLREWRRLKRSYGGSCRRKLKGVAVVRLPDGSLARAEVHWYEAHGIGRRELKIKRLLSERP